MTDETMKAANPCKDGRAPKPDNMELWRSVETTNPAHTKKITFGRAITAIDPYRQMEAATKAFGPAGTGWGWEVKRVEYLPTNEIGMLISLWHGSSDFGHIEQWGQASLYIDKKEEKKDTDCFKKATTDGVTKCLSYIGFNADVFLGKFDDNKYVEQAKAQFEPKASKADVAGIDKQIKRIVEGSEDESQAYNDKASKIYAHFKVKAMDELSDSQAKSVLSGLSKQ